VPTHEELGYNSATPVATLLPTIEAAWARWRQVLSRVPEERITEPGVCDAWSVKDLLGHVAFWDTQVLDDIDGYGALRAPLKNPWNDWNAAEAAKRAERSVEAQRSEMESAHQRMLARLAAISEIDAELIGEDTWLHYEEHVLDIERWLNATSA
jgi:hypothetical protein